jgi:hypothetical protein
MEMASGESVCAGSSQKSTVGGLQSEISLNDMIDASNYELMGYSIGKCPLIL